MTQARDAVRLGSNLADTRKRIDLAEFGRRLAGEDEARRWMFENYVVQPIVERAWREARADF